MGPGGSRGVCASLALPRATSGRFIWKVPLPGSAALPSPGSAVALRLRPRSGSDEIGTICAEAAGERRGQWPAALPGLTGGNGAGKRPGGGGERPRGAGTGGGTPTPPSSPLLPGEAAPAALACSQGSVVLQEKLCLPAVRSSVLQIHYARLRVLRGGFQERLPCKFGEGPWRWQVLCRAPEMLIVPKSTPWLTCCSDRALTAGRSWDTLFLGLLSRVLCFLFVLPCQVVPKFPLLVSCKKHLTAPCPYPSRVCPALDHGVLFSSSKIGFSPP